MADLHYPPGLFADPARASDNLLSLHETFIRSGSRFSLDQFSSTLDRHLRVAPDTGMALMNLIRFSEASVSKTSLFNDLLQYPATFDLLMTIFGHSQYFADILVREPGLFRWLTTTDVLHTPLSRADLTVEFGQVRDAFARIEGRIEALKRIHRREMLRIGTQDLLGVTDLAGITLQLSDLADLIVDEVWRNSVLQLRSKYGTGPADPFAVIALGKLGGQELNYSSDIDVVFVYGAEGDFPSAEGTVVSHHEYFVRLSERVVQNLTQPTAGGTLYRVDTRLRPEAGVGPLARSLQGYLTYYESRGEPWERQMLIKARTIAGDADLGASFVRELEPFVYPRSHFVHPADAIARIKSRIEEAIGERANVKLMRGGIRDIEFTVQALELLNGGAHREVRERNTLSAIEALKREDLLLADEAEVLREAYIFFRHLEHRLQTVFNTQTHSLPDEPRSRHALARRLGLKDAEDLLGSVDTRARSVRSVFNRVLAGGDDTGKIHEAGSGILTVIDGGLSEQSVLRILAGYGFRDARLAARHLRTLISGSGLTGRKDVDARTRDAFRAVAPQLFSSIARTPVPGLTLANLVTVVTAQRFQEQMYHLLAQVEFRDLFIAICGASPRFSRALAQDPLFVESLSTDPDVLVRRGTTADIGEDDLHRFKARQELRAGIRHLLGLSDFEGLTKELTAIADACVSSVVQTEAHRAAGTRAPLAVFALGKFGTHELTFDADLDLLFIADAFDADALSASELLAESVVTGLTHSISGGKLYDVDARLRPEGRNAPLVTDWKAYVGYLAGRASLWERQSLTRLRFVAGDRGLGDRVTERIEALAFDSPLPAGWIPEIVAMRRRTESRSRVGGGTFIDFKLGAGGMVDIEFLVQILQLHFRRLDLRHRSVGEILAIPDLPSLTAEERDLLHEGYRMFRAAELRLRIGFDLRTSVLPAGESLEDLALMVGFKDGTDIVKTFQSVMAKIRSVFLRVTDTLNTGNME